MAEVDSYTIPAMTTVTIVLDLDEACALRDLLRFVGGHRDETRRQHATKVYDALVADPTLSSVRYVPDITGGIIFEQPRTTTRDASNPFDW